MGIQKEKTYLVFNYSPSYVSVVTRYDKFMLDPCNGDEPKSLPLTLDEIQQVHNNSKLFKTGHLRFEPQYEKEIYEALHIRNWESILTNEQIEDIIINPTTEKLESVIEIDDARYFNRIYGVYIGMKNAGFSISSNVDMVMTQRYKELSKGKKTSAIPVGKHKETDTDKVSKLEAQIAEMQKKLDQMVDLKISESAENTPDEMAIKVPSQKSTKKTGSRNIKPKTE